MAELSYSNPTSWKQCETHRPIYYKGVVHPIFDQPSCDSFYTADQLSASNDGSNHQSKSRPAERWRTHPFHPSLIEQLFMPSP